jgi:carboxyl-terminal processing protease
MNRTRKFRNTILLLGLVFLLWLTSLSAERALSTNAQTELFSEVWQTVERNFFDPRFNGVDWPSLEEQYGYLAGQAHSREEFAVIVNEMLARLQTSHTRFYIPEDPRYYQLLAIFAARDNELQEQLKQWFPRGKIEYTGIGCSTEEISGNTFVSGILDGSPAARAGLLVGDRLLAVDGQPFEAIGSFRGKAGREVALTIEREKGKGEQILKLTPQVFDASLMFEEAMERSVQLVEREGKKIGYIHIWSYAGEQYQQLLEGELLYGRLREADALVLDLRGGWGGAPLTCNR